MPIRSNLHSMTGFAREAGTTGPHAWAWELKSVNGRGFELRTRVPPGFEALGETARTLLAARLSRGQCQLNLTLNRSAAEPRLRIDTEALAALMAAVATVERPAGIGPATLDGLLAIRGVIDTAEQDSAETGEALRRDLAAALERLVEALAAARAAEGAALARVLDGQLDEMARLVAEAEAHPGRRPEAIAARLAEQVAALLGASPDAARTLDPQRLHQEAALIATRADIREELDRLAAHLAAARELLADAKPVGRRLDFLTQEFARETNTLCAKANDVALSRVGLALKAVVEQFREQVQNVE